MAVRGKGALAIWNDVPPGGDEEFHLWHTREHQPERVGIVGFLRGRRWVALEGQPKYFTLYETETLDVLDSAPYLERLNNPTPWTRSSLGLFQNTSRTACSVTYDVGQGVGGALCTIRLGPRSGREQELRDWLAGSALPALYERRGMVGATLCEADPETTNVPTAEKGLRAGEDVLANWVILADALEADSLRRVVGELLAPSELEAHGAARGSERGIYQLMYCLEST
jgi:hypothetical protein